jgi:hypothetical protein
MVARFPPLLRMLDHPGTHHVEIGWLISKSAKMIPASAP